MPLNVSVLNSDPLPQTAHIQPIINLKFGDGVSWLSMQAVKLLTRRSFLNQMLIPVLPPKHDGLLGIRTNPAMYILWFYESVDLYTLDGKT